NAATTRVSKPGRAHRRFGLAKKSAAALRRSLRSLVFHITEEPKSAARLWLPRALEAAMRCGLALLMLLLAALVTWLPAAAQADKRVALVIGNGAYQNTTQLKTTKSDAAD